MRADRSCIYPHLSTFIILPILRIFIFTLTLVGFFGASGPSKAAGEVRAQLVKALLSEDLAEQTTIIQGFVSSSDPIIPQVLTAWRGGEVYAEESGDTRVPVLLDSQADEDGNAKAIRIADGEFFKDTEGKVMLFTSTDLTAIDADSKLRKVIKATLDLLALGSPDPKMRRDATVKLGQEQNVEYIPNFEARLKVESIREIQVSLREALAITRIASDDAATRVKAVRELGQMKSINSLTYLQQLYTNAKAEPAKFGAETLDVTKRAIKRIEEHIALGGLFGTAFRGFSLSAVLLVASLGLAITFGLMGVINMAHGEIMMVGAYTAFVTQNIFKSWFGASGTGFDCYFLVAVLAAFIVAAIVGLILERGIIRFLYKRPLESLLATWGVSLVLQQIFRDTFGAANVQVSSPSWLSGSFVVNDVLLAYNRLFVIGFAFFVVILTYALLTRTSLGLQIRAVMQNRNMAAAIGVRTDMVNMQAFAFGSGLAGMAGACLSQLGNVGPSLGQNHIVDCFMVVVLGGVGNLIGTVLAALGIGVTDQILQPWLGAVMGKITVLICIILFLQWRPAGLFVTRSRSLEG